MSAQLLSHQVLAVVGPTATGKSAVAMQMAEEIIRQDKAAGVTLISVDSRQVYQGLEVVSGADIPSDWKRTAHFTTDAHRHPEFPIFLFGTSLIEPTAEWSVTNFRQYALPIIAQSFDAGFVVILVGGTGLYHEHLFSTDPLLDVPPDENLRREAALLSLEDLLQKVQTEAPEAWAAMNDSDRQNPRRLVRALEKTAAQADEITQLPELMTEFPLKLHEFVHATIGILDSPENLKKNIAARIEQRFQLGAVEEVQKLIGKYDDALWKLPAFSSTGCKELRMYIEGRLEIEQLKELWLRRELQYAKRQLTWWKSHPYATSIEGFRAKTKQWTNLSTSDHEDWQTAITQSCILGLC